MDFASLGFRKTSMAMKVLCAGDKIERAPSHETCIQWTLKVGCHKLMSPKKREDGEWMWIADRAVKSGAHKCLAILGIRMDQIAAKENLTLTLNDVKPLAIVPMKVSNRSTVNAAFEKLAGQTGIPRGILTDRGSDMKCGATDFSQRHKSVVPLYDIVHKLAIELSKYIGEDPNWQTFAAYATQAKKQLLYNDNDDGALATVMMAASITN